MIADSLTVARQAFESRTGWLLKPEGACKGELCIPLTGEFTGPTIQLDDVADQLGLALVHDEAQQLWAVGPEATNSHALATAVAPNLTLPTLAGDTFELASLRGKKVLLLAWAPY